MRVLDYRLKIKKKIGQPRRRAGPSNVEQGRGQGRCRQPWGRKEECSTAVDEEEVKGGPDPLWPSLLKTSPWQRRGGQVRRRPRARGRCRVQRPGSRLIQR
jgi:hypothetical protein